jgi:ADP-ribose pyrophosphatase
MEKSERQATLEKQAKVQSKLIYQGHTLSLRVDTFSVSGEPPRNWDIIQHPGAVTVLPINDQGELLLVKQWRRAAEKILIELPAGGLEIGESPQACAQRELQEETGFKAADLISLGGFYSAPGFCTEYLHFFLARNLSPSTLPSDDGEGIDLLVVSLDNALKMIDNGTICDLKTIAGIFRYQRWLTCEK